MSRLPIRPPYALAAAGIIISAALAAAVLIRPPGGSSPIPTEPAAAAMPTATLAPGSERYGLIVGRHVRSEADARTLGDLGTEHFSGAVSPDGRKVAYWEAPGSGAARLLRLLEGSAPAQPRILLTLPDTEAGGGVAWSTDGTGLLIAVQGRDEVTRPAPEGPPDHTVAYAALRQLDLASGSVREIARSERAFPLKPVAWDRGRGIAAAVGIGPGGGVTSYVLVRDGAPPVTPTFRQSLAVLAIFVRAAPDASHVLAADLRGPRVYVWPLAEPERLSPLDVAAGERVVAAMWRNAREIVVSVETDVTGADRLELWPLEGPRRVLLRGRGGLDAVRPDGSAAIVSGQAVELVTGATSPIPGLSERVHASFLLR